MNAPRSPNIAADPARLNRTAGPRTIPRRADLSRARAETLTAGAANKADVFVVDIGEGPMVVKDFGTKPIWSRLLGRVQIAREVAAYRHLDGVEGVPRLVGRVDAHALAIEKVPGERLAFHPRRIEDGCRFVGLLRGLIDRIHARGVVHNDLRGRENLLVRDDGSLVLVDLAGAVRLAPGGLAHRLFFRVLARADEAAFLKWKDLLLEGDLTDEERASVERFRRLRALWPFNRKRGAGGEGP